MSNIVSVGLVLFLLLFYMAEISKQERDCRIRYQVPACERIWVPETNNED